MFFEDLVEISRNARQYAFAQLKYEVVSANGYRVLHYVSAHQFRTQEDIAAALQMDKGNLARTLAKMEESGLIERKRNPNNRRAMMIFATEQGRAVWHDFDQMITTWSQKTLSVLSDEEQMQFLKMLERIRQNSL